MPKIKIGLIGYGDHMRDKLLMAIHNCGLDVELVAVCKARPEKLDEIKAELKLKLVTTHYQDMLNRDLLDAIIIALPDPELHAKIAAEAIVAGIHVFAEKPLTLDMDTLAYLDSLAAEHPEVITAVGFNFMFAPYLSAVTDALEAKQAPNLHVHCAVKNYSKPKSITEVVESGINFALIHPISVIVDLLGPPIKVKV